MKVNDEEGRGQLDTCELVWTTRPSMVLAMPLPVSLMVSLLVSAEENWREAVFRRQVGSTGVMNVSLRESRTASSKPIGGRSSVV